MPPAGALAIVEDVPGRVLHLAWDGPRTIATARQPRSLRFDGVRGELHVVLPRRFLTVLEREVVVPLAELQRVRLELAPRRSAGPLPLTMVVQQATAKGRRETRIPLRVHGLDLPSEARDLLFRIARTGGMARMDGPHRSAERLHLGFYVEQERSGREKGSSVIELVPVGEGARPVPPIELAADYQARVAAAPAEHPANDVAAGPALKPRARPMALQIGLAVASVLGPPAASVYAAAGVPRAVGTVLLLPLVGLSIAIYGSIFQEDVTRRRVALGVARGALSWSMLLVILGMVLRKTPPPAWLPLALMTVPVGLGWAELRQDQDAERESGRSLLSRFRDAGFWVLAGLCLASAWILVAG